MSFQNFPSFFLDFSATDMDGENGSSYRFRSFTLNLPERRLSEANTPIPLTPKAFDVLSVLVQQAGHLVEKEELMSRVWPDSFVEEANVARVVHTLRKKLCDDGNGNSFWVLVWASRFDRSKNASSSNWPSRPSLSCSCTAGSTPASFSPFARYFSGATWW